MPFTRHSYQLKNTSCAFLHFCAWAWVRKVSLNNCGIVFQRHLTCSLFLFFLNSTQNNCISKAKTTFSVSLVSNSVGQTLPKREFPKQDWRRHMGIEPTNHDSHRSSTGFEDQAHHQIGRASRKSFQGYPKFKKPGTRRQPRYSQQPLLIYCSIQDSLLLKIHFLNYPHSLHLVFHNKDPFR